MYNSVLQRARSTLLTCYIVQINTPTNPECRRCYNVSITLFKSTIRYGWTLTGGQLLCYLIIYKHYCHSLTTLKEVPLVLAKRQALDTSQMLQKESSQHPMWDRAILFPFDRWGTVALRPQSSERLSTYGCVQIFKSAPNVVPPIGNNRESSRHWEQWELLGNGPLKIWPSPWVQSTLESLAVHLWKPAYLSNLPNNAKDDWQIWE